MDWWPTLAKLAGLEPPPHDWKDNDGNPIIFDGIDLSESLLGTGPGKRDNFIYFNDQSFGGVRVKNFKALYTAKDTLARTGAIPKDPGALRSLVGPGRELRHRVQRCGADAGRLQDLARPLFRPGQWLDRPLHQPRDDAVLG
jgi:arylsulfatase A-like enzyme